MAMMTWSTHPGTYSTLFEGPLPAIDRSPRATGHLDGSNQPSFVCQANCPHPQPYLGEPARFGPRVRRPAILGRKEQKVRSFLVPIPTEPAMSICAVV